MRAEDGTPIDMNAEVQYVAELVFAQDDVPLGAVVQVLTPSQKAMAGWCMVLIRHPSQVAEKQ